MEGGELRYLIAQQLQWDTGADGQRRVGPRCRRVGIGTVLTKARLDWIWERSDMAFYFANEHNAASIQLHRTLGFEPIATAPTFHQVTADGQSQLILFSAKRR